MCLFKKNNKCGDCKYFVEDYIKRGWCTLYSKAPNCNITSYWCKMRCQDFKHKEQKEKTHLCTYCGTENAIYDIGGNGDTIWVCEKCKNKGQKDGERD